MRRRLNVRALFWTFGCVAVLSVSVSLLHGYQVQRNAHYLRDRGRAIAEMEKSVSPGRLPYARVRCWAVAGDPARGADEFARALKAQPEDALVLAAAADFHRRADNNAQAAAYYERLLEPGRSAPPDVQAAARRQLAILHACAGDLTQATALLDVNLQALGEQPADQRIRWFIEGQNPPRRPHAVSQLLESFRRFPSESEDELLLIQLLEAANDAAQARDRLAHVLLAQETPQQIAAYIRLLIKLESVSEAEVWLAKLERWEPASPRTLELKQHLAKTKS